MKYLAEQVGKNPIALAVSGGADSMYMAMRVAELFPQHQVTALIVDHGLRQGSAAEAKWVQQYLQSKNINAKVLTINMGQNPTSNIQKIARNKRYEALFNYCNKNDINVLCTAHNLDDQAETIFMKLERGSGLDGACGISARKQFGGIIVLRPILDQNRQEIEQALKAANWQWVEDPSNHNTKFKRALVRKFLRSYTNYDELRDRLALFAQNMNRVQDFVNNSVSDACSKAVKYHELAYAEIDLSNLLTLHLEIAYRVLINAMQLVNGKKVKPRQAKLQVLFNNITHSHQTNQPFKSTFDGCLLILYKQKLLVIKELKQVMKYTSQSAYFCDPRYKIVEHLPNNYTIKPLGPNGYAWLKKQVTLPKLASNIIYQVLPAVYDGDDNIVAVYKLYGNWQDFIISAVS